MKKPLIFLLALLLPLLIWTCSKDENNETAKSITITAPNGGENWAVASSHNVTWTDEGVDQVNILLSTDGAVTWTSVAANVSGNSHAWVVSNSVSANCKIKVESAADVAIFDVSNAIFVISAVAEDAATGTASSSDTDTSLIVTPGGVTLVIPPGAVPTFDDGSACTQSFSIESTGDAVTPPAGETVGTDVYRFGPEGFTFASPVEVSFPIENVPANHDVLLYRTNEATGDLEQMPAVYDPATHRITTTTYEFCCWFGTTRPAQNTAAGCIQVDNISLDWVRLCVDTYTLDFPDQDDPYMASYGDGALWAPPGTIGWASSGKFFIPQGTFRICKQWRVSSDPEEYVHEFVDGVAIHSAWNYWDSPNCSYTLTFGSPSAADPGRCNCVPQPSTPAHTGEVQVTLTWYVPNEVGVDMDLHVVEPSGEEIYYGHTQSATGGQLDMDHICGDFRNGISENIFWTTNPPTGEYIVKVHYYGNCSSLTDPQSFSIRTVVRNSTQTYANSCDIYETKEICRFSVSGSSVHFLPPQAEPAFVVLPAKN